MISLSCGIWPLKAPWNMKTTHAELPEKHNSESTPSEVLKFFVIYHPWYFYLIVFPERVYRKDNNLGVEVFQSCDRCLVDARISISKIDSCHCYEYSYHQWPYYGMACIFKCDMKKICSVNSCDGLLGAGFLDFPQIPDAAGKIQQERIFHIGWNSILGQCPSQALQMKPSFWCGSPPSKSGKMKV